jgi:carbon storage regulator
LLVLSRHRDEWIHIGEPGPNQVRICVIDIRGGKVRLGVEAPNNLPVNRKEVEDVILRTHQQLLNHKMKNKSNENNPIDRGPDK